MEIATFARILFRYLHPYWVQLTLLVMLLLVDIGFTTAWPLGFKLFIDHTLADKNQKLMVIILGWLLAGVVVASLAAVGRDYYYAFLSAHVLHDVRLKIFSHLQHLSLSFYSRMGTGDLMARFSSDLAALENAVTWAIASLLLNSLTILLGAVLLFVLEWRLGLLTLVGLILCVFGPRGLARRSAKISYEVKASQAMLADIVQENIHAQPVVKAFGLERQAIGVFQRQSSGLMRIAFRFGFLSYLVERLPNITILIFEILVIGAGLLLVFYGYRTLGTLVAFHAVFLNISASVGGLTSIVPLILQSMGGLQRIEEILNEKPAVIEVAEAIELPKLSHELVFRKVTFGYNEGKPCLDQVSIEIPVGAFVALVGSSGSGKSTILNLILRFYDPDSGSVVFDGTDVRQVSLSSLRGQTGLVFQDNVLFNLSVRENIRLGNPGATNLEVENAARAAEMHDYLMSLDDEYETSAGEGGRRFSGGQRQRLALARALVRNPSILLLDEATSALDPATEAAVNATLLRAARNRMVISVTHRLSTITNADRIFVLDQGQVREQGTHEELLAERGIYAELWRKQTGFTLSEGGEHAAVETERLKDFPVLSHLDDWILSELAQQFVTERYPPRRRVIIQGDPGNKFYIIVRGKVEVTMRRAGGDDERIAVLQDGDYFGEIALLQDVPRTATVLTLTASIFLTLERTQFTNLVDQAPNLRESLARTYLSRIKDQVE
jgi:ATP-binding cassette subfamily B protein